MGLPHNRRRLAPLLRTLLLAVTLAAAPVSLAAENPGAGMRTSGEIEDDLERARAEQESIARQVEAQQREVAELEALQTQLTGEIDRTAAALDAINADLTAVRQQIVLMVDRIEQIEERYAALVTELEALDVQLADLIVREEEKRVELRERQALLADRLRAANDADRTSLLEVFLSSSSYSEVLAEVAYHLDAAAQDKALAARIKRDQETLATLRETIESTRRETNLVRQETAVQKKRLDAELALLETTKQRLAELEAETARELAAERAAFEELSRTRSDLRAAIERGQAEQAKLSRQISALIEEEARRAAEEARRAAEAARRAEEEARAAAEARAAEEARRAAEATGLAGIPSAYNGTFTWPLVGRVTGEWGCSQYPGYGPGGPGCAHFHNGIDIARECGSAIVAAGDGTVVYVGWNWADGPDPAWMVVIAHSTGLTTWYAHMAPSAPDGISIGSRVTAGQVIGYEGNTGRSTGCHLHWMVELNGSFVNGRLFL